MCYSRLTDLVVTIDFQYMLNLSVEKHFISRHALSTFKYMKHNFSEEEYRIYQANIRAILDKLYLHIYNTCISRLYQ